MLRINSATKNLLVICFEGVKNIKQILHCVQDDSQCQGHVHFHPLRASVVMKHSVVTRYFTS
jgi:hypothetical protein